LFFRRINACILATVSLLLAYPLGAAGPTKSGPPKEFAVTELRLDGGRKLTFESSISDERQVKPQRGFWKRLVDTVAGAPEFHHMVRPYGVITDSRNRVIVTDPGAVGIHIFDFAQEKYQFLSHTGGKDPLRSPQCVAVDARGNIYVTDSDSGKIFVFDEHGKHLRVFGSLKGGEGFFKRPTGIAIDSEAQRIYLSDTLRNKIFVLDLQGNVLQTIGQSGEGKGEFNYPTELRLQGPDLLVVDAMNFRVQVMSRSGVFQAVIGQIGDEHGGFFRPKGIGTDSEGHIYVVEGLSSVVQVFDREGRLLYYFGQKGTGFGEFQLPVGLFIDGKDRVFVVDSFNRRVQVFQYTALAKRSEGQGR